jgi:uncharacterized double-CXXCG motif protein
MRIYEIDEEESGRVHYGYIDGNHSDGGLPGVFCHGCNCSWAAYGLPYPTVDITSISGHEELFKPTNVTVPHFEYVRQKVRHMLPPGAYLPPGTSFGPVSGKVHGKLAAFAWTEGGMLINAGLYNEMLEIGLLLPEGVPANLSFPKGKPIIDMLELNLLPVARLSLSCYADQGKERCEICGRLGIQTPWNIVLKKSSIPRDVDVFREQETSTKFATDAFRDYCLNNDLKNIRFREQAVAMDE